LRSINSRTLIPLMAALASVTLSNSAEAQRALTVPDHLVYETDVRYGSAGDAPLMLDLLLPRETPEEPLACVVWIHGGGWQKGDKSSGLSQLLSVMGDGAPYVGASIGYRLTDKGPWPAQGDDVKAAIRWLRANAAGYHLDADRIGIWGSSAGGHLVNFLGTSGDVAETEGNNGTPGVSSRVACVVDFCGPADFLAFGWQSNKPQEPGSAIFKLLEGPPAERREAAIAASPITYVSADDPPFLVVHGTVDPLVPLDQAKDFHTALTKAGVDSTFVLMEGGGHGIRGPEITQRVGDFFGKHLLGKNIEISADPIQVEAAAGN